MASAMPVFPLVASIRVSPRLMSPRFSASTIIDKAGRSLTEPAGLLPSSLASITLLALPTRCRSCTSGVLPTVSSMVLYMGEALNGRRHAWDSVPFYPRPKRKPRVQTQGSTMLLRQCGGSAARGPTYFLAFSSADFIAASPLAAALSALASFVVASLDAFASCFALAAAALASFFACASAALASFLALAAASASALALALASLSAAAFSAFIVLASLAADALGAGPPAAALGVAGTAVGVLFA